MHRPRNVVSPKLLTNLCNAPNLQGGPSSQTMAVRALSSTISRPRSFDCSAVGVSRPLSSCPLERLSSARGLSVINNCHPQHTPLHRQFSSLPRLPKTPCPFRTLNIPKDSSYAHAKKSFLKIAMKHHPDTFSPDHTAEMRQKSQDIFMKCRSALENLVECENTGAALLRSEVEEAQAKRTMSNEEFDSWFEKETGHHSPFAFDIDPQTMREVAKMHETMEGSHGLDRDGGMWHLASLISSTVKSGKEGAADLLRLEAGSMEEGREAKGKLERRRKRVRGGGR